MGEGKLKENQRQDGPLKQVVKRVHHHLERTREEVVPSMNNIISREMLRWLVPNRAEEVGERWWWQALLKRMKSDPRKR